VYRQSACSGWFTHISGHPSAAGRVQDRESSPARDRRSTTVPRHQLVESVAIKYSSVSYPDVLIFTVKEKLFFNFLELWAPALAGSLDFAQPAHPIATPLCAIENFG